MNHPDLKTIQEASEQNYAGISGDPVKSDEKWTVPSFLGAGTGLSSYKANVLENSGLPSLMCLTSVREKEGVIHSKHDALYFPEELGGEIYRKFPLTFDGVHYSLPIDKVEGVEAPERWTHF